MNSIKGFWSVPSIGASDQEAGSWCMVHGAILRRIKASFSGGNDAQRADL